MQRLGDYIKEYSARNKLDEEIPVYSVTNSNGFCRDYFGKEVASNNKRTYKIVPRNAFAYNPSRINVGSVDYQHYEDRVIVSPLYNVFTVDEKILPQYLYFYLKSPNTMKRIRTVASGSVRDNLKLSMLCEFPIQVPSINRQQNIIELLEKAQRIIDEKNDELEKLDNLIKARFVEMFSFVDSEQVKIAELVEQKIPTAKKDFESDTEIKYIDISSIDNRRNIVTGSTKYKMSNAPSRAQQHVQFGDILISTVRPNLKNVAMVSLDNDNLVASSGFCVLRPKKCTPEFLMSIVCSDNFTNAMINVVTGANYPSIKNSDILNYYAPLPSKGQQKQFSNFVAQVDKSKFALVKSIKLLKKSPFDILLGLL